MSDYVDMLPKEPPEGLVSWLLSQGEFKKEYLIYRAGLEYVPQGELARRAKRRSPGGLEDRNRRAVEVTCTACGETFYADKVEAGGCHNGYAPAPFGWFNPLTTEPVIEGSFTTCPVCNAPAQTKHIGTIPNGIQENTWTAVVSRLPMGPMSDKKDRLLVTDWMTARSIDKRGKSKFWSHLYSAWVVEEKKIVRIMGYLKCMSTLSLQEPMQRKTFVDVFGEARNIYPWDAAVLEGTTAENSKLDLYQAAGGKRLIAYLGLWLRRPAVENLVVQGFGGLVTELLDEEMDISSYQRPKGYPKMPKVNWKEKRPGRMLGMNREELRIFREKEWGRREYRMIRWARDNGVALRFPEGVEQMKRQGTYECENILGNPLKEDFWRILRYLDKQKKSYSELRDYWNMAGRLKMDLEDGHVRWPKDLKAAHDRAVERYNLQKDQLTAAAFAERTAELAWLRWEHEGLVIRPCESETELRREGRALHHCVATYAQRHAEGKTAIFFIRRAEEPERPYFTLELDEEKLTVRQNRGLRNCDRTAEVQAFETAWLEWARSERQKQKKVRIQVA